MFSKLFYVTLLTAITFVCGSCAPNPSPLTETETPNTAHSDASASSIHWQPCAQLSFTKWFPSYVATDSLECATIKVALAATPVSTANTAKPTVVKLALSRLPATGSEQDKLGTLINISGGPGQSGLDVSAIDSAAYAKLSKHFDIIGYAPRGVYPSTPTIKCSTTARMLFPEDVKQFTQGCWEHTPHDLLAQLGADYAVDDIEAIRKALGVEKINLIGYSYGTKIAALYAEKFPTHLRAGVLDGVVNLNETDLQVAYNQAIETQKTFERFVQSCRQQADCFFADTSTVQQAEAKLAKLYLYIENNEFYDLDHQPISPMTMSWVLGDLLTWPEQWPLLNELLVSINRKDFELFETFIDDSKNNVDYTTFVSISCADGAPTNDKKADYIDDIKRIDARLTWDDYRKFDDEEILDACYYWPVKGSDVPHIPKLAASAPPLLLVAQTNDPATPYINAVAMQKYLNSMLLTRRSDGHTLALADLSSCVDNQVVDYLIDPKNFALQKDGSRKNNLYCLK